VRLTTTLRASVVLAALATGSFGEADPVTLALGMTSAEAKEFYTRKRVRGRWVTGHFGRWHSAAPRRSGKRDDRLAASDSLQDDLVPATPTLNPNSAAEQRTKVEPILPAGAGQEGTSAALSAAAPLASDKRLARLQEALHAHARTLASTTEPASGALPAPGGLNGPQPAPASKEPKAVSFDFQSGVKTTVFVDDTKVEEPFDPAAMKGLAAAPTHAPGGSGR
jgi:hypothetical protein